MDFIKASIQQPVTVAVGVILTILAGLVALARIPIQLTPNVEDTIIAVTTMWEGASPLEIEQEIVNKQEEKLQGLANMRAMTSQSMQGQGLIRLEFNVGTPKDAALREVSDKLREVASYPANAKEPVVEASDPQNKDYIAWMIFGTTDPTLDIRTLQDFAEDRIKPFLERVEGMSEIGVLGGRERETQIRVDPVLLAQRGISTAEFAAAIQRTNLDISAGELADAKSNVRVRTISQYESIDDVERTIIKQTETGLVRLRDVAEVVETFKEPTSFVRSRGKSVIAINAQREVGSNVMDVMQRLKKEVAQLNVPGGLLEAQARKMNLNGNLSLTQVFDQTVYIDDALALVQENIWLGGALAVIVLLLFLRSIRSVGIIALSIPISMIGAIVAMVALGRTINVISLAGLAFAIGMVVDDAIVVLENIFRHLEMGKKPFAAAYDATKEVWGAVLASTLTTMFVFIPILLVQEEAGQLFRDIALAIVAAMGLSMIVAITVVPTAAARVLKTVVKKDSERAKPRAAIGRILLAPLRIFDGSSDLLGRFIYFASGSVLVRVFIVAALTAVSVVGTIMLIPASDYLPTGNRNMVFGIMIAPPGYTQEQQEIIAARVEETVRPYWEASGHRDHKAEYKKIMASLPQVPTFNMATMSPGPMITPSPLENYFFVGLNGSMFHGGIGEDPSKVVDMIPLFQHATRPGVAPDVMAFAMQVPLFQLGGFSGSAVKINFSGADLQKVTDAATLFYGELARKYGPYAVQPDPPNFNIPGPELQVVPNRVSLSDVGMSAAELGLAIQASGDGAIIGEYRKGGESVDLKIIAKASVDQKYIGDIGDTPIATPSGAVVSLSTLAELKRVTSPPQINRVGRQRSVTLQFTAPPALPLEQAIADVEAMLASLRQAGKIGPDIETGFTGSASKLKSVQKALLGDGTWMGTLNSTLALALLVTYLLLCVLFQSWLHPLVIMFSVPLATLGGFAALQLVHTWSINDRYMPVQKLDVLTMLGFVILIGVVVKNAILIVHQALNFMHGISDVEGIEGKLTPRRAIAESVRTRLRPIMMSSMTSVLGMAPLVLMPGAGSELYRGLGAVVLGGLTVSTVFTLVLVPLLMSLVLDIQMALSRLWHRGAPAGASVAAGAMRHPDS